MDSYRELRFRVQLAQIQMEALGMEAANAEREQHGFALAYSEESFDALRQQLLDLEQRIVGGGCRAK